MQTASNLTATTSSVDFTVDKTTGAAYISQRKLAELLGVAESSLRGIIKSKTAVSAHPNTSNNSDLDYVPPSYPRTTIDEEMFFSLVEYYAFESKAKNDSALDLYKRLAKAGARAYIYHMAGYVIEAKPAVPQTYLEALKALVVSEEARLLEVAAHERTQTLLEEKRLQLDESREYLSIKRVAAFNGIPWKDLSWRTLKGTGLPFRKIFDANYGEVNAYHHTAWEQVYPELELPM